MKRMEIRQFLGLALLVVFSAASLTACDKEAQSQKDSVKTSASKPAPAQNNVGKVISGKVAETMNSGGYTYVLIEQGDAKTWVAMPVLQVSVGDEISVEPGWTMTNFTSRTLNRTFESIVFSPGPSTQKGAVAMNNPQVGLSTGSGMKEAPASAENVKVEKAAGPNAFTVEETYEKKADLKGRKVDIRGMVVKVSRQIMGKNWVHLRDGTGDPQKGTNDLLVTTQDLPNVGDVVTANGIVHTDKDFGAGYRYDVIVEEASIRK